MIDALPVTIALADPDLAADVTAHVESVLGWQVVAPGPHLVVRLALADDVDPTVPTVVVARQVDDADLRRLLTAGALDVLAWPRDADRLPGVVPPAVDVPPADLVVAVRAASGGVGASTVALAVGAHHAWAGRRTAVLTDPAGCRLAGTAAGGGAVAGVPGLAVVASPPPAGAVDVLVVDRGVAAHGQVLVGRPDAALGRALDDAGAGVAVVAVGTGGMRPAELAAAVGTRRFVRLRWSFRVARAGLRGRVPVGLPGSHLAPLRAVAGPPPARSGVAA